MANTGSRRFSKPELFWSNQVEHITYSCRMAKRHVMLASLRYLDTFVKTGGAWLLAERLLYVDWLEERSLS